MIILFLIMAYYQPINYIFIKNKRENEYERIFTELERIVIVQLVKSSNDILRLHKIMISYLGDEDAGKYKRGENEMFNLKKETIKKNIFLVLYIIFAILGLVGAFMIVTKRLNNVGYVVIPMLFALISSILYRNSKKAIEENTK